MQISRDITILQSSAVRGLPHVADFLPSVFISRKLLPAIMCLPPYLHDNVPVSFSVFFLFRVVVLLFLLADTVNSVHTF